MSELLYYRNVLYKKEDSQILSMCQNDYSCVIIFFNYFYTKQFLSKWLICSLFDSVNQN